MANASSSSSGNWTGGYKGGITPNVTLHAWPIPKLDASLKQTNNTNYVTDKSSESAKNYTFSLHNLNATGYIAIDEDLIDTGLTDVQTFILAGVATVIPLLIIVITILGVKYLWRRYRAKKEESYEGVLQKEESSEPLGKLQTYSLPQELKTSESQFTVTPGEDPSSTPSIQFPTPKSNGSVITMTLKNNHLIVETEETTNTPEGTKMESKGTTTKFVTSKAPNFCFESSSQVATVFPKELIESQSVCEGHSNAALTSTNHGALVHNIPFEMEDELEKGSCNTGLSQSDLSVSSSESQNPSYCYGNQTGYDCGCYGYPEYSGYTLPSTASKRLNLSQMEPKSRNVSTKWASIGENANSYQREGQAEGQAFKDILMSDIQAREKRVHDIRVQEQNRCENCDSVFSNKTETSLSNSRSLPETTTPEPQLTHLKSETFQLEDNCCLSSNGINGKETGGS